LISNLTKEYVRTWLAKLTYQMDTRWTGKGSANWRVVRQRWLIEGQTGKTRGGKTRGGKTRGGRLGDNVRDGISPLSVKRAKSAYIFNELTQRCYGRRKHRFCL